MSDEEPCAARDKLFWTLSEHSTTSTERLRQLTNTVGERTALALCNSSLRALQCSDYCSSAIETVVAELERVCVLDGGMADTWSNPASFSIGEHTNFYAPFCTLLVLLLEYPSFFESHRLQFVTCIS